MAVSLQQAGVEVDPVAGDVDSHADITNHLKKSWSDNAHEKSTKRRWFYHRKGKTD